MKSQNSDKTNAARILDAAGIPYELLVYSTDSDFHTGEEAAAMLGLDPSSVFKTLVCQSDRGGHCVFVIPVNLELDLKNAAKAAQEKRVEMIPVKEITAVTGYIKGGCSPVGMKKRFPTFIHESAILFDRIWCSAGRRGIQMGLSPDDLLRATGGSFADIARGNANAGTVKKDI